MSNTAKPQGAPRQSGARIPGSAQLQRLGKSLMLPIAVLPAAGILLRLGQPELPGRIEAPVIGPFFKAMGAAGDALFTNLPLLFTVGVAISFAGRRMVPPQAVFGTDTEALKNDIIEIL